MRKDPLQGALAEACKPLPPAVPREEMRNRIIKEMHRHLPRTVSDWEGWRGTFVLAEAALNALGYPQDGT